MSTPKSIGRYEIIEQLGHGAMGLVYRAKDPMMGRIVAVKTITFLGLAGTSDNELRDRFYREARAAGNLSHPGIVSMFDVGEHEGVPFLVMEFVAGRSLADAMKKGERLRIDRVCEIGQQIAEALGYAHRRGVVHRDIKPANILLTSREIDGKERPKIADFGVAKVAEGQTTLTGQILGTPAFMPPEQIIGAPIDGRADLFSLGVVLYWMAVGELPFPGESLTSVSYKVVHTDPAPPQKLNPAIPAALEQIILKCMAKSPADRYQTGEELAQALAGMIGGVKPTATQTFAAQTTSAPLDPDATLVYASASTLSGSAPAATVSPAQVLRDALAAQDRPKTAATKRSSLSQKQYILIGAVALVIALVAGGWLVLKRMNSKPQERTAAAAPQITPAAPNAPATPSSAPPAATVSSLVSAAAAPPRSAAPNVPAKGPAATVAAKPSSNPAKMTAAAAAPAPAPAPVAPAAPAAPAMPDPVDFNPVSLDPKTNSRLRLEMDRTPQNLDFMVEMNGKLYFHKLGGATPNNNDGLFVPPGVQEFRVVARNGAIEKVSNTVSAEFQAKKRKTLTVELRVQGANAAQGMPEGLYPDTQIVLGLK